MTDMQEEPAGRSSVKRKHKQVERFVAEPAFVHTRRLKEQKREAHERRRRELIAQRQAAKAKPDPKVAKEDNGAGQPGTASPARDRGQRAEGGSKVPTARPGKRLSSKDSESGTQSSHRMSGDASLASETQSDATSSATADSISREGPPRPPARPREFKQRPDPEADKRGSSTSISAGSGERERREAGDDDGPPEVAPPSRHQAPPPSSTRPAQAGKVRAPGDAIEEAREAVAVKPPARAANEGQGDPAGSKGKQAGPDARPAKTSSESRPRSKTTRAPLARDYSRTMGNPAKMTHLAAPFSATLDMEAPVVAHGSFPAQNRAPEGFGFVGTAGAGRPFPGETPVGHPHAMFHHGGPGGPQTASPWAAHPTQGAAHQDGCHPVTPVGPGSAAGALGAVAGPAVGGLGAVGGAAVGSAWPGRVAPQLAQVTQGGGAVFGQRASERQAIRAAAAAEKMRSGELAEAEVRDYAVAQKDYAIRAVAPDGGQGGKDEGGWRGGANEGEEAYEGDIRRSGAVVVAREVQGRNPAYAQLPSDRRIVAWLREYEKVRSEAPPGVLAHAELRMFPLDGTCSARNLRQEITISIRSLIAPPLEITCTPGDFVHSIKQHLRVVTQGVLHPDRVQLRLASGMVLESYSLTSRELRLADYGIFSDTSILLRMTWSQKESKEWKTALAGAPGKAADPGNVVAQANAIVASQGDFFARMRTAAAVADPQGLGGPPTRRPQAKRGAGQKRGGEEDEGKGRGVGEEERRRGKGEEGEEGRKRRAPTEGRETKEAPAPQKKKRGPKLVDRSRIAGTESDSYWAAVRGVEISSARLAVPFLGESFLEAVKQERRSRGERVDDRSEGEGEEGEGEAAGVMLALKDGGGKKAEAKRDAPSGGKKGKGAVGWSTSWVKAEEVFLMDGVLIAGVVLGGAGLRERFEWIAQNWYPSSLTFPVRTPAALAARYSMLNNPENYSNLIYSTREETKHKLYKRYDIV